MHWLTDPLASTFFVNALIGGGIAALICAVAGAWVVVRGMAFLGDALAHGMLPGVAIASLLGGPAMLGAAISATVMSVGVGWLSRRHRLNDDTAIGIFFVGMLGLGVIIVSHSRTFATDLTVILFGDILAIRAGEIAVLLAGLIITVAVAFALRRPLLAMALDERIAATLRMRPAIARIALAGLVTIAVVASYQAVGTLLVVALLVAPPAAASLWASSVSGIMRGGALIGLSAVTVGLFCSWHFATAAGASIAVVAVLAFGVSLAARAGVRRLPKRRIRPVASALSPVTASLPHHIPSTTN